MQFVQDRGVFLDYLYEHCHCANARQTPEMRRLKYKIARYFGKSTEGARQLRDWNNNPFAKFFGYSCWKSLMQILQEDKEG